MLVFPKDINVNALVRNNMTVSGLPVQQPQPLHVYVGGVTSRETVSRPTHIIVYRYAEG